MLLILDTALRVSNQTQTAFFYFIFSFVFCSRNVGGLPSSADESCTIRFILKIPPNAARFKKKGGGGVKRKELVRKMHKTVSVHPGTFIWLNGTHEVLMALNCTKRKSITT